MRLNKNKFTFNRLKITCLSRKSLFLSCLLFSQAFASFPTTPGFSLTGLTGFGTTGYGDSLVPLFGQSQNFFYASPQVLYHNSDNYAGGLGLGQRWFVENSGIFGAYVFGDYNHSPNGHNFWFISPGVERLGNTVDISANLYIPVGKKTSTTTVDYVFFQGHGQFEELQQSNESVGMGGDVEIGYRLPVINNSKVYLGGYYFNPDNNPSITGGSVRLELPVTNRLSVLFTDSYDNSNHNVFKAGLTFALGGRQSGYSYRGNLSDRMVDPIHRNLASISGSYFTHQPIVQSQTLAASPQQIKSNLSFFLPDNSTVSSTGNGTYENPYIGFKQASINNANAEGNTNFYVESGTYNNPSQINFSVSDSVYGRQNLFTQPAVGSNRPLFVFPANTNGFNITGNAVLDSLQFQAPSSDGAGILFSTGDHTASVNNISVSGFQQGLLVFAGAGTSNITVANSSFSEGGFDQLGVNGGSAGSIVNFNVIDSTLTTATPSSNGIIIFNNDGGTSNVNVAGTQITSTNPTSINGIGVSNASTSGGVNININNSVISGWKTAGISVFNPGSATPAPANITVNNSVVSSNSVGLNMNNSNNAISGQTATINSSQFVGNTKAFSLGAARLNVNNNSTVFGANKTDSTSLQISEVNSSIVDVNQPNFFTGAITTDATSIATLTGQDQVGSPVQINVSTNAASVTCATDGTCAINP